MARLAERFGVHRGTVGKHLRARGVVTASPGLHPDDVPAALELYEAGWTYARIADKFGVSQSTVRDRLHEAGVPKAERYGRRGRNLRASTKSDGEGAPPTANLGA
ncbi:helix-turn-helix domain-containing protein [Amycolatopsis sp. NPDC051758]|uniref:helix-turn-helix domain-containing protein n=1 Tax=Amycolatopsis sp. NPDC051758 TaxID=3363935 RepID=UPI0037A3D839